MSRLLVIDDDIAICRTLQLHFSSEGHDVTVAHSAEEGLDQFRASPTDIVILDIRMAGRTGLQILPEIKHIDQDTRVVMITAFHDMESTIEAMKLGADDYIHKPMDLDELDEAVSKALRYSKARETDARVTADSEHEIREYEMVGHSSAMKEVFKTIGRLASSNATVLISGESGTGKELVARAIHRAGPNPDGPFVAVNCAAIVDTLLESDLFGHEKGSFTGAVSRQLGKFALADGGTILLDEISELSAGIQAKLLRVLQDKEIFPIGSKEARRVNARVIAATNLDLQDQVEQRSFRHDLYYRIQVVNIHLPPLRDRTDDIPDLVENLLTRINLQLRRPVTRVPGDVIDCLKRYSWPGNVRELENVLTKAVAVSPGDTLTVDMLPPHVSWIAPDADERTRDKEPPAGGHSLADVEKQHVMSILEETNWHRGRACEVLGISRPRLRRLMVQYGLEPRADSVSPDSHDVQEQQSPANSKRLDDDEDDDGHEQ